LKTAVIVPSVGRTAMLDSLLSSLESAQPPPDETHVVFQGVADPDLREALTTAHPGVNVHWASRIGASAARNEGALRTSAELLLFVDDDCRVDAGWIAAHGRILEQDSALGISGGKVVEGESLSEGAGNLGFQTDDQPKRFTRRRNPVGTVDRAGNLAIRSGVFRKLGGFDDHLGPGTRLRSAEDCDLIYRAMKRGVGMAYTPAAIVHHDLWRSTDAIATTECGYGIGLGAFIAGHARAGDAYALSLLPRLMLHMGIRPIVRGMVKRDKRSFASGVRYLTRLPYGFLLGLGRRAISTMPASPSESPAAVD
jgi:GT2 family glycosyltransferase